MDIRMDIFKSLSKRRPNGKPRSQALTCGFLAFSPNI